MRGITPVVAIILMLLIAVAAAGGAFFFIQGFRGQTEEATGGAFESITDQIEENIVIETSWMEANGMGFQVKNVGQTPVDCTSFSVFVDDIPYTLNYTGTDTGVRSSSCGGTSTPAVSGCTDAVAIGASALVRITSSPVSCADGTFNTTTTAQLKIITKNGASVVHTFNPYKGCSC